MKLKEDKTLKWQSYILVSINKKFYEFVEIYM